MEKVICISCKYYEVYKGAEQELLGCDNNEHRFQLAMNLIYCTIILYYHIAFRVFHHERKDNKLRIDNNI